MRPVQHRLTGELRAFVGPRHRRCAALRAGAVEDASEVIATECVLRNDGNSLMRRIVDDD